MTQLNIPFEKYTLENGMRVILAPDHSVPVVAVYVLYDVGARAEERGRTGFAHLFEHMMFQGSVNAPKGFHFQFVESNGGSLNGSTHPDYTDYFEILPANKLPVALWLEADRMRGLDVNQANLDNQRDAVKEEKRLSFDNQPYNPAIVDHWPTLAYRNWSNAHSLIGSYEDLDAATLHDVKRFFETYYAPNNAILTISGDFDPAEARRLIEESFASIPPQQRPPQPDLTEPEPPGPVEQVWEDPLAKVPALVLGYPACERRAPDFYALVMLDAVLTAGDSCRFQRNLVKKAKSIIQFEGGLGWPFAGFTDYRHPGMISFFLLHNPQFEAAEVARQVQEEIDKVAREGVSEEELARYRTYLKASRLSSLQTSLSRARLLTQYELLDQAPELINQELAFFESVTPKQVAGVAGRYCTPDRRTTLYIQPAAAEQPEEDAVPA